MVVEIQSRPTPYLSALDFRILDFGVYFKLGKKSSSKPTWFFFEFELDFYCLCSLQKSISKSNWFFSFLNLIFWNWKKFECHSISQKSSGDRQGVTLLTQFCINTPTTYYKIQWYTFWSSFCFDYALWKHYFNLSICLVNH